MCDAAAPNTCSVERWRMTHHLTTRAGRQSLAFDLQRLSFPLFHQVFAVFEIGIEWFAHFLDQRDLAMLESFAPSNDEQAAPGSYLYVRNLEGCDLRDPWTRIAEQGCQRQGQSVITTSCCFGRPADRIPFGLG